jgi:hypothetical protein
MSKEDSTETLQFGRDAFVDCLRRLRSKLAALGLNVYVEVKVGDRGVDAEGNHIDRAAARREKALIRRFWKENKHSVASDYTPDEDDLEQQMAVVRGIMENAVYPFLDRSGERQRPLGIDPEELMAWLTLEFAGRNNERVEALEDLMRGVRMADFETPAGQPDWQLFANENRRLTAEIESVDPNFDPTRSLKLLVRVANLHEGYKGQGEYFSSKLRAGDKVNYLEIKEAFNQVALDLGHTDSLLAGRQGGRKVLTRENAQPRRQHSAEEKDQAFVVDDNRVKALQLQLQIEQARCDAETARRDAAYLSAGAPLPGSHPPPKKFPTNQWQGNKNGPAGPVCWNKWCGQLGHRRSDCKTPKPAGWVQHRDHGHIAMESTDLCIETALMTSEGEGKATVDGAASTHVSSLALRQLFSDFGWVKDQFLRTAGGDVPIVARATMTLTLFSGDKLVLRNVAILEHGCLVLLGLTPWFEQRKSESPGTRLEVAYLPERVLFREDDKVVMQGQLGADKLFGISFLLPGAPIPAAHAAAHAAAAAHGKNLNLRKRNKNLNLATDLEKGQDHDEDKAEGKAKDKDEDEDLDTEAVLERHALFYGEMHQTLQLLHLRTNHGSLGDLQDLVRQGAVEMPDKKRTAILAMKGRVPCDACDEANVQQKHPRHKKIGVRDFWTADVSGPFPTRTASGNRWACVWVSPPGRSFVTFHRKKNQTLDALRENKKVWEIRAKCKMTHLRTDRGVGEFRNKRMRRYCGRHGIIQSFTAPDSSAGAAESRIRVLQDKARASMNQSGAPESMWAEAINYANQAKDMLPSQGEEHDGRSTWEIVERTKPPLHRLHSFGCLAFAHRPKQLRRKFENRGRRAVFLSLADNADDGYRMWDIKTGTVFTSRSVVFHETTFPWYKTTASPVSMQLMATPAFTFPAGEGGVGSSKGLVPSRELELEKNKDKVENNLDVDVPPVVPAKEAHNDHDTVDKHGSPRRRRSRRTRTQPEQVYDPNWQDPYWWRREKALRVQEGKPPVTEVPPIHKWRRGELMIPQSAKQIELLPIEQQGHWKAAMRKEMASHAKNKSLRVIRRPKGKNIIPGKWVFDLKYEDGDEWVTKFKARKVAGGHRQKYGKDYWQTFAATPNLAAVRTLMMASLTWAMVRHTEDVVTAFLIPTLPPEETVYMEMGYDPDLNKASPEYVYEVLKCLYGLKQASRAWRKEINSFLLAQGFVSLHSDPCLYVLRAEDGTTICMLAVHVDDILLSAHDPMVEKVKALLGGKYEMKDLGELTNYVGIRIRTSDDGKTLEMDQRAAIEEILEDFGMATCSPSVSTPVDPKVDSAVDPDNPEVPMPPMDQTRYRELVGRLIYVSKCTRPDICFAVGLLARFMQDPSAKHWQWGKRVLRYLKGSLDLVLRFTVKGLGEKMTVVGYSDSDWAGCVSTRKSTSGQIFMMGRSALSWKSARQATVARSTCEAELIALNAAVSEAVWFKHLLTELTGEEHGPVTLYEDNESAKAIAQDDRQSERTKHMDVKHFAIREFIESGDVVVESIASADNLADMFTKGLQRGPFCRLREAIGVVPSCIP